MKNIDFKAIFITVGEVVAGVAAWEMVVKPMVSKKKTAVVSAPAVVTEG